LKKFLLIWTTPIVASLLVVLKVKPIEDYLKRFNDNTPLFIGIALAALTLLNQYLNVFSPFKKYEKWAKNKWYILNQEADKLVKKYKQQGVEVRINIMVPTTKFFYSIEPKKNTNFHKKFTFVGKVFKDIWSYGDYRVNKLLKLTTNQGISGRAFKRAEGVLIIDFVTNHNINFNLNKEQEALTKDIIFIARCPITVIEDGSEEQTGKVVGVLNLESYTKGSERIVQNAASRQELTSELAFFSKICSKLM
jgi:hypothetical protein